MNGAVLTSFPSPPQGVWDVDLGFVTLPIRAYALCIIVGIIVAVWWGEKRWAARGGTPGTVLDISVFAVPFGLVGGRLYHVITDYYRYFGPGKNPVNALKIWDGGLGIWGAIALGGVGVWIACRRRKISTAAMADAIAPCIVTAQAIGRLGNYFNQELFGDPTTLPWGLEIFERVSKTNPGVPDALGGVSNGHVLEVVHPTFLYELIWNLLVAAFVVWMDRRFRLGHGRAFALYVAGYTLGRFCIELMRSDPATHILGVRVNVFVAALVFVGALVYFIVAAKRGGREAPESLRSPDHAVSAGQEPDSADAPADTASGDEAPAPTEAVTSSDAKDD